MNRHSGPVATHSVGETLRARTMRRFVLPSLLMPILLACKEPPLPRTVQISEAAASHTTELAAGDRLEITLAENITTGYHWTLDAQRCHDALHLDGDQATRPSNGPPGAGGRHTWTFTARSEARCDLRFQSVRPWEKTATGTSLVFPVAIRKGP